MNQKPVLAIIGGSGLYDFPALQNVERIELETPFGKPSAPILQGTLEGKKVAFLARHGIGHIYNPSEVNYRANIYALKSLGVEQIISISACGSLREDFAPGQIVVPSQLFDYTHLRKRSFFEDGLVVHVSVADPFCPTLSTQLHQTLTSVGATAHQGGAMITIEGPRFSTKIESNTFRSWGLSLIGMTTSPEAFLAREAEICYAVMAHVTDYDVWHMSEESVNVDLVVKTLHKNTELAQQTIIKLISSLGEHKDCSCNHALENAIITNKDYYGNKSIKKFGTLLDKYIK
jgi:5'-methylthioadenosine phosphorylase